jgi:hypothetical protein
MLTMTPNRSPEPLRLAFRYRGQRLSVDGGVLAR